VVLAEALSAGLPAVAVEGPGVRESVRHGVDGIVVDHEPASTLPGRLAEALSLAADPRRRSAMGERARADAERFSIERRVAELEELYASLQGD
jgi:glycosyltransferase involved in cell wall biosynthesis